MNIQDAIREFGNEIRREQTHVTRKADEIDFVLVKHSSDLTIVNLAFKAFRRNHTRGDAVCVGAVDSRRAFAIADDDGDFRVPDASRGNRFCQSFEIRSAAAQEHANALLHKLKTLTHTETRTK